MKQLLDTSWLLPFAELFAFLQSNGMLDRQGQPQKGVPRLRDRQMLILRERMRNVREVAGKFMNPDRAFMNREQKDNEAATRRTGKKGERVDFYNSIGGDLRVVVKSEDAALALVSKLNRIDYRHADSVDLTGLTREDIEARWEEVAKRFGAPMAMISANRWLRRRYTCSPSWRDTPRCGSNHPKPHGVALT